HDMIDKNPADGMRPPKPKRAEAERDAFTDEDLRAIFGSDYRAATLGNGDAAKFWVPLVLLFTGARLEEIAQLNVADVGDVDGIPCVRITTRGEGQKRLKSAAADRTVPTHSGLIALGFLDYVAERRSAGDRRVFPRLSRTADKGYGVSVSKWFTKWKRAHGITSRLKGLHSLRPTFSTKLKAADVQEYTISELAGHENDNITTGRYGKRLQVCKLRDAIEKLDVREGLRDLGA